MRRGEPLAWGLVATITLHTSLAVAIVLGHHAPQKARPAPEVMVARLIRLGRPRAPNLLPRRPAASPPAPRMAAPVVNPPTKPEKEPPQEPPEPTPAQPAPPAKPAALSNAMARARALAVDEEEEPEGRPEGVPEGTADQASEGDPYATEIWRRIRAGWRVADLVPDRELVRLRALVFLRLSDDGRMVEHRIVEPSGNRFFDASVLEAVQVAQQLPPPPADRAQAILQTGILLEFIGAEAP